MKNRGACLLVLAYFVTWPGFAIPSLKADSALPAAASGVASAQPQVTAPSHTWRMPTLTVSQRGVSQPLKLEKTHLAQTKAKSSSMSALASDPNVAQGMEVGASVAGTETAIHTGSWAGGTAIAEGGSVFTGVMSRRKPPVTYVWCVPGQTSANVLQTAAPEFLLDFSQAPGVAASDYLPEIVKLTPSQGNCRIVGASEGKQDAGSDSSADWPIYSHFLEESVPVKAEQLETGKYKIAPASGLLPGEYAVVLRPVSKAKKFSGADVARAQGDGLMCDAVWTFQIPESVE